MASPANSNDAFRFVRIHWRITGLYPPKTRRRLYRLYAWPLLFIFMVVIPIHLLVSLALMTDFILILDTISIGLFLIFIQIRQILSLISMNKELKKANEHLSNLDTYSADNEEDQTILRNAIKFCHRLYYLYAFTFALSHVIFSGTGLMKHQAMFEEWFPFDPHGQYWYCAAIYQMTAAVFQGTQNVANDIYPLVYLILSTTHSRLLNERIMRIGKDKTKTIADNNKELKRCIKNHQEILEYHDCISVVISRTMLAQFMTTAFILCTSAVFFLTSSGNITDMMRIGIYLSVIIMEIFPCCWYVNTMIDESSSLTTALYNCEWYDQDQYFRKMVIIFMEHSQKSITILAGSLAPVTLQTFISIIRFSFSMFTFLSQSMNLN